MHFAIRYLTSYEYDVEVVGNVNALRVRPPPTAASGSTTSLCG